MSVEDLGNACEANDIQCVNELIKLHSIQLNIHQMVKVVFPDYDPHRKGKLSTVLNVACHFSCYEIFEMLLPFSNVDIADYYRNLPIHYASGSNVDALRKIQTLLEQTDQHVNTKGYVGSPLLCAAMAGNKEVVEFLFENGASIDSEKRLLHRVTATGNAEIMQLLITNGADPKTVDDLGQTVLHCAARFNTHSIIDLILQTRGEVTNSQDSKGNTPLHLATEFGKIETVKRLTTAGKCDFRVVNNQGKTVLEIAEQRNKQDIVAHLSQLVTIATPISAIEREKHTNIGENPVVTADNVLGQAGCDQCVRNKTDVKQTDPQAPQRKPRRKLKSHSLGNESIPKVVLDTNKKTQNQGTVSYSQITPHENGRSKSLTKENTKSALSESGGKDENDVFYENTDYLRHSRKSLADRVESLERRLAQSDENRHKVVDEKLKSMYDRIRVIERRLGRLRDNTLSKEKKRETQLEVQQEVASLKDTVLMLQRRLDEDDKGFSRGKFQDKVLMRIAKLIGSEQFQLRAFLDVSYEEYQQFLQKHPHHPVNVSFEILRTWRDNNLCADDREKLQKLMTAFREVDRDMDKTLRDILT